MPDRFRACLRPALLFALGWVLTAAHPLPPQPLTERLDRILDAAELQPSLWGVYVQDLQSGEVLYERNAALPLMPASNQKLLTMAAVLALHGPDRRFQTTLHFDGEIEGSVLRGDLILEGAGDPSFGSREVPGEDPFTQWAAQLAEAGVTRIEGRLIGDDDAFDDEPYPKGWDVDHVTNAAYAPPTSGLSYYDNTSVLALRSVRVGASATLEMQPSDYLDVENEVRTHARRRGRNVQVERDLGDDALVLSGSVHPRYRGSLTVPISNPTAFALHSFAEALEAAGISVEATLVDVDDLGTRPRYGQAQPLLVAISPPMQKLLELVGKDSNNLYAESLFRSLSQEGSIRGSARRTKNLLTGIGVDSDAVSIYDGSGLSRKNLVAPAALGQLLAYMRTHTSGDAFWEALPAGGEAQTTLQSRLRGLPVRAKTGSLQNVRALSGYVETADGRPLVFVVIANNFTVPAHRITRAIDAVVLTLASFNGES